MGPSFLFALTSSCLIVAIRQCTACVLKDLINTNHEDLKRERKKYQINTCTRPPQRSKLTLIETALVIYLLITINKNTFIRSIHVIINVILLVIDLITSEMYH